MPAGQVTVATTNTLIYRSGSGGYTNPSVVTVRNTSAQDVFLNINDAATTTSFALPATSSVSFNLTTGQSINGIVAATTSRVDWISSQPSG